MKIITHSRTHAAQNEVKYISLGWSTHRGKRCTALNKSPTNIDWMKWSETVQQSFFLYIYLKWKKKDIDWEQTEPLTVNE